MPRRLSIIIPVYNEAATAATLLKQVAEIPLPDIEKEIIAVESNSTDGSRAVVQSFEKNGTLRAIYEDRPQGKGHAVRAGLAQSTGEWILIQDADLEYDVNDYPALLAPLHQGVAFVLGSRHMGKKDWRYRRTGAGKWVGPLIDIGVWLYTGVFNLLYGTALTDPFTMYKVFRRDCLRDITLRHNGFEMDLEIVGKLVRKGYIPVEVPVKYQSRNYEQGKKVRMWRDGPRVLGAILRSRWGAL